MIRFRFFLSEAWEIQVRDRANGLASLTALTAVLFLLAIVLLAGHNVRGVARGLEARKGLQVFLAEDVPESRIAELEETFRRFGEVSSVTFVSAQESLSDVESDLGGVDVVGAIGENPLSPCFEIRLTPESASRSGVVQQLAREIGEYDGVDEVLYGGSWIEDLERGLRNVYWATVGAGLLAAAAVLLVLWNTLKLAFISRRETIRILKVVGATPGFIRSPYVLLGALQAAVASVLALLLAAVVRLSLAQMMPGVQFLPPVWAATFLGGAIFLGIVSSVASVEPALRNLERRHASVTS
jgi:cell division transport system permease protein